jgi:hypothetical protein
VYACNRCITPIAFPFGVLWVFSICSLLSLVYGVCSERVQPGREQLTGEAYGVMQGLRAYARMNIWRTLIGPITRHHSRHGQGEIPR